MKYANVRECEAAGLNPIKVEALARRLLRAARDAEKLGLTVFGGTGRGDLRIRVRDQDRAIIVARMPEGRWDGGDGGCDLGPDGLLRGES